MAIDWHIVPNDYGTMYHMQRIRLASRNPHPIDKHDSRSMAIRRALFGWWGREIIVDNPIRPRGETICGTAMVWPIVGPPELVEVLAKHDLTRMACVHCFMIARFQSEEVEDERIAV